VAPRSGDDLFCPYGQYGFGFARCWLELRRRLRSSNTCGAIPLITSRGVGLKCAIASAVVAYTLATRCSDGPPSAALAAGDSNRGGGPLLDRAGGLAGGVCTGLSACAVALRFRVVIVVVFGSDKGAAIGWAR
jgi:hypothetical protein